MKCKISQNSNILSHSIEKGKTEDKIQHWRTVATENDQRLQLGIQNNTL